MRKKYNIILLFTLAGCLMACTANFENLNKDPYGVNKEELSRDDYAVGASFVGMQGYVIPTKEHLHQFHEVLAGCSFAGYLAVTPAWTDKFSTYNPPVDWVRAPFNDVLTGISPLYESLKSATNDPVYLALGKVLRVAAMHRVTDTYGPIPYSKMNVAGDGGAGTLTAPYDPQDLVYKEMIKDLDAAISVLTENRYANPEVYAGFDRVFAGKVSNWLKFANSLKLRIALRMSYVNPSLAQKVAEEAVEQTGGVMMDNADNAAMRVAKNPLEIQVVQWGDDRAGADIITYMNSFKDPRREKYFTTVSSDLGEGFHGLRSGIDVPFSEIAKKYSMPIVEVGDPLLWMNAAEVTFLRAEGALRGWKMGDNAENLYNKAIRLSFEEHKAAGVENYLNDTENQPHNYKDPVGMFSYSGESSKMVIKWNEADDFEMKLEKIITQKWIAIFPLGIEAWSEFRRTAYPKLMPVVLNKSGGTVDTEKMIRRLPFPDTEYQENMENLYEAIKSLGGPDNGGTKLWWDAKK